jgi:hypothetical protein
MALRNVIRHGFFLCGILAATLTSPAQNPDRLEFRLQADPASPGTPRSFSLLLVNKTGHDIYLPVPRRNCEDRYDGWFRIFNTFKPLNGPSPEPGSPGGCAFDQFGPELAISDRIGAENWRLLHSGESLNLDPSGTTAFTDSDPPGVYEFWASYSPPAIGPDKRKILQNRNIDIPQGRVMSNHLVLTKTK